MKLTEPVGTGVRFLVVTKRVHEGGRACRRGLTEVIAPGIGACELAPVDDQF